MIESKHCVVTFTDHPILQYETKHLLFHIADNTFLLFDAVSEILHTVLPTKVIYTNMGDPYREFCRLYYITPGILEEESMDIYRVDILPDL